LDEGGKSLTRSPWWNLAIALVTGFAAAFWYPESRFIHLKHQLWAFFGVDALLSMVCLFLSAAVTARNIRKEFSRMMELPGTWKRKIKRHLGRLVAFVLVMLIFVALLGIPGLVAAAACMAAEGWIWFKKGRAVILSGSEPGNIRGKSSYTNGSDGIQ
jgi:hypothetical protein